MPPPSGDSFNWTATAAADWSDPANWVDNTTGQSPAVRAPGSLDATFISPNVEVTGTGAAAFLGIGGGDTLSGSVNAGTVLVNALLDVNGLLTADLVEGVDGNAVVFQVTSGHTLVAQTLVAQDFWINDGRVVGEFLSIGMLVEVSNGRNGFISYVGQDVAGAGTFEVLPAGTLDLIENASTPGLTFQLDGGAIAQFQGGFASGTSINLIGSDNTIFVDSQLDISGVSILGFDRTDTLALQGSATIVSFIDGTLDLLTPQGQSQVLNFPDAPTGQWVVMPGSNTEALTLACFAAGTGIETSRGRVAVEDLREGDPVLTISGEMKPVTWIGHRTVDCRSHAASDRVRPVRIMPHAFGQDQPRQTLYLSPDHAVYVDGILCPAGLLVNGKTVTQIDAGTVTYWHVELAAHDVVFADGLPCETYLDTGGRAAFESGGSVVQLHPAFAADQACAGEMWDRFGYAPLIVAGVELDRVRALLAWQAGMLAGSATPEQQARRC